VVGGCGWVLRRVFWFCVGGVGFAFICCDFSVMIPHVEEKWTELCM
jgi:hypothetical protein